MAFEVGQRVGDYEIVSMLGVGGMGRVYRVRNVISDRTEAMKVLLPDLTAEPDLAVRFISEIRTLASFDHPNIAQLHTAFQVDNQLVMMMEFVEGSTLEQRAKQAPMAQDEVIGNMLQVLAALSYAHSRKVVHRDIKPANIMVTSHGVVKLMDFGIAKSKVETELTRPGTTMGSLYYMSPEQVRGAAVDARSDLYSVGIMMYELLAGRRPFEADTAYGILNQQLNVAPQPPVEVNPLLPRPLNDIILNVLAKDPAQRFQNADAFRNALRQVAGHPAAAVGAPAFANVAAPATMADAAPGFTPVGPPAVASMPPPPPSSGHRAAWITLGAVAVLAILIGAAVAVPHFLRTGATAKDANTAISPAPVANVPTTPTDSGGMSTVFSTPVPATPAASTPAVAPAPGVDTSSQPAQPAADLSTGLTHSKRAVMARLRGSQPGGTPQSLPNPVQSGVSITPAAPSASAAPSGPSPQEAAQAREEMTELDARASAVSSSLENLKRQQEADGLGLRQDMAAAYARMNSYLRAAGSELDSGNIDAARNHMEKADKEISTLERFLGK